MRPASEPMLTMAPPLRAIMPSSTARVQLIMPHRLSWTSFSHSARSFSTKRRSSVQPTLLTSTSTRPVRASTSRTVARTESHLVTSVGATTTEAAPALRASPAVFSPCPASISAMVTWAPSRAKASEMARPMLEPPPVTMTLLPLRLRSMRSVLALMEMGIGAVYHAVVWPPSRYTLCPVMKSEAADAMYTARAAASSGWPRRRAGILARKRSRVFASAMAARGMSVFM